MPKNYTSWTIQQGDYDRSHAIHFDKQTITDFNKRKLYAKVSVAFLLTSSLVYLTAFMNLPI